MCSFDDIRHTSSAFFLCHFNHFRDYSFCAFKTFPKTVLTPQVSLSKQSLSCNRKQLTCPPKHLLHRHLVDFYCFSHCSSVREAGKI